MSLSEPETIVKTTNMSQMQLGSIYMMLNKVVLNRQVDGVLKFHQCELSWFLTWGGNRRMGRTLCLPLKVGTIEVDVSFSVLGLFFKYLSSFGLVCGSNRQNKSIKSVSSDVVQT